MYAFHPAAEYEYLEAIAYYESKGRNLGRRLLAEFKQNMEQVCESPLRFKLQVQPDIRKKSASDISFHNLLQSLQ